MLDLTWKIFSQTGNIEAYLLLKDLEDVGNADFDYTNDQPIATNNRKEKVFRTH